MFHERNLPDISEPEDTLDATTDSRTRDRNDVMEATSGIDTGKTGDSSTSKRVARPVNSEEKSGYTSLHDAARDNAYKAAAVLLESGADANAEDDKGHTPLHIAAERKAHEAVKVLCRHRERRGWSW